MDNFLSDGPGIPKPYQVADTPMGYGAGRPRINRAELDPGPAQSNFGRSEKEFQT